MKYAHIYKAKNGKFTLWITDSPSLADGVVSEENFGSKKEAKDKAKEIGAKAWNY